MPCHAIHLASQHLTHPNWLSVSLARKAPTFSRWMGSNPLGNYSYGPDPVRKPSRPAGAQTAIGLQVAMRPRICKVPGDGEVGEEGREERSRVDDGHRSRSWWWVGR